MLQSVFLMLYLYLCHAGGRVVIVCGIVYMVALSCPKYQGKVCCVWGGLDVMQLTHCKLTLAVSWSLVLWKTCHVRASQVNFQINGVFLF